MSWLFLLLLLVCPLASAAAQDTPATDRIVQQVRLQAEQLGGARPGLSAEHVLAVAIMNQVQSRVSSLNYSLLSKQGKPLPTNVEECLQMEAGICGNHIATFLEIARRLKLRCRPVEFYVHGEKPAQNHSHICVEVFYRDKWRLLDVTWGTYYRLPDGPRDELASIDEIRASKRSRGWAVTNETDLWYQQWKASGLDPIEYIDFANVDILRGRAGAIRLVPIKSDKGQKYQPIHQPGYVGRNVKSKDYGPVSLELLKVEPAARSLEIKVAGLAGAGRLVITAGEGGSQAVISFAQLAAGTTSRVDLSGLSLVENGSLMIRVLPETDGGIGYVVYSQIILLPR
jgi:hypothetical protein